VQKHDYGTVYLHQVLEAKLLGPGDLTLSIGSEFIANDDAQAAVAAGRRAAADIKQDCELKAFSRLAPQLKQDFPQLRLCLTVDSLYACGRFFQVCQDHHWAFVATFKPKDLPVAWDEFQRLLPLCPANVLERRTAAGARQVYRWVKEVSYTDTEKRDWSFTAVQLEETVGAETTRFAWLTPLHVSARTVVDIAEKGGRPRWKIENQGFNRQKNSGLNLQHLYSTDPEKAKAYYYILQIAFILLQLLEQGSLLRRLAAEWQQTPWQLLGGLMNVAWLLLESLRRDTWAAAWFDAAAAGPARISFQRFDSS
jgi:hypothetical protein